MRQGNRFDTEQTYYSCSNWVISAYRFALLDEDVSWLDADDLWWHQVSNLYHILFDGMWFIWCDDILTFEFLNHLYTFD